GGGAPPQESPAAGRGPGGCRRGGVAVGHVQCDRTRDWHPRRRRQRHGQPRSRQRLLGRVCVHRFEGDDRQRPHPRLCRPEGQGLRHNGRRRRLHARHRAGQGPEQRRADARRHRSPGMTFADLPQAVANKSVDFALGVEPFIALGEAQNIWVRWKSPTEIYPGAQIAALLYGPTMNEAGKDVGNRFMVAYTKGLRDYYEAFGPAHKGRPEIVSILVNNTAVKQPALYDQMAWNYLNPNCSVNLKTLPADLEWYVAKGLVPPVDVNQVVDNSY